MKTENFLSVLRIRPFLVFSLSQTVSQFGDKLDWMALIALLAVYTKGSPTALSQLMLFGTLPALIFGPLSGVFVDRWHRKKVMITCDACRMALVFAIPFVIKATGNILSVYAIVFFVFLCGLFFNSSKMSIIPNLVSEKRLLAANSVNNFIGRFATVAGTFLGGFVVAWAGWQSIGWRGWEAGFYLDSFTYLLSVIALSTIAVGVRRARSSNSAQSIETARRPGGAFRALFSDLGESFRLIITDRAVTFVMGSVLVLFTIMGTVYVTAIVIVQQILQRGTAGVGTLGAIAAVGMIVGSLVYGMTGARIPKRHIILVGFGIIGLLMICFSLSSSFLVLSVLAIFAGLALAPVMISQDTLLHEVIPEEIRGRIFGAREWGLHWVLVISALLIGLIAELTSVRGTLLVMGAVVMLVSVAGEAARRFWKWPTKTAVSRPGQRYQIIDHPADVGVRAFGTDLSELFSSAAYGMFDILADLDQVKETNRVQVEVEGRDLAGLLREWLSELLYRYETDEMVFKRFEIEKVDEGRILANCWGELRNPERHHISTEIKSVTYHQLKVEKIPQGWVAEVIFDI